MKETFHAGELWKGDVDQVVARPAASSSALRTIRWSAASTTRLLPKLIEPADNISSPPPGWS
jgi:hypothetical protein